METRILLLDVHVSIEEIRQEINILINDEVANSASAVDSDGRINY